MLELQCFIGVPFTSHQLLDGSKIELTEIERVLGDVPLKAAWSISTTTNGRYYDNETTVYQPMYLGNSEHAQSEPCEVLPSPTSVIIFRDILFLNKLICNARFTTFLFRTESTLSLIISPNKDFYRVSSSFSSK